MWGAWSFWMRIRRGCFRRLRAQRDGQVRFPFAMNEPAIARASTDADPYAEPTLGERMRGAIWGQFVGDAFCLGSHWIYNLAELESAFPGGVQGFEEPREGHYHAGKKPGEQTHYGDAALVMLESVAESGHFDPADFLRRFEAKFGSEEYRGYCDKATRGTLDHLRVWREEHPASAEIDAQNGGGDDQLATASRPAGGVGGHFGGAGLGGGG